MGGSIRVIIKKDDIIHKQTRWTNNLPEFIKSKMFIERDSKYFDDYINEPSEFRERDDNFSPEGYGIIVIDFDSKKLFSSQNYTSFERIDYVHLALEHVSKQMIEANPDPIEYYPTDVKQMWDAGMLTIYNFASTDFYEAIEHFENLYKEISICESSEQRITKRYFFDEINNTYLSTDAFYINWGKFGWELKETYEDIRLLYEELKQNYHFTKEENERWISYIGDRT